MLCARLDLKRFSTETYHFLLKLSASLKWKGGGGGGGVVSSWVWCGSPDTGLVAGMYLG